ncbi:MAG: hypothetical protein AB7F86_16275 [Bdellovibrionales bacterium]
MDESYFQLERSNDGGTTFSAVGIALAGTVALTDINLQSASSYQYRVKASNSVGDSAYSNTIAINTPAAGNTASYAYISANIIGPNCVDCHGPGLQAAGYNFSTYATLSANRNAAINSIKAGRMPPGAPLSAQQIGILDSWLGIGAPNN